MDNSNTQVLNTNNFDNSVFIEELPKTQTHRQRNHRPWEKFTFKSVGSEQASEDQLVTVIQLNVRSSKDTPTGNSTTPHRMQPTSPNLVKRNLIQSPSLPRRNLVQSPSLGSRGLAFQNRGLQFGSSLQNKSPLHKFSGDPSNPQGSFKSAVTGQTQFTNQSSVRSQEKSQDNRNRYVRILKNLQKQAKLDEKEKKNQQKKDSEQDFPRTSTMLKRSSSVSVLDNKTSSYVESEEPDDETNDEGIENEQLGVNYSLGVFMPDSIVITIWNFFTLVLILQQCIWIPFQLSFLGSESLVEQDLQLTIDILFMIDILVTLNEGIYYKGVLILNRKEIFHIYLKTWFVVDVISCVPYNYIFDKMVMRYSETEQQIFYMMITQVYDSKTKALVQILKAVRFLRMVKLLKVLRLQKIMKAAEEYIISDEVKFVVYFSQNMITIIFFAHWIACFYWVTGGLQDQGALTWIIRAQIQDAKVDTQYVFSLYWAIQTMCTVGYGDLNAKQATEQLYATFGMFVVALVYAYTLNNVSEMFRKYNQQASQYREKMMYVNQFLIKKKLPIELRTKVWRYLQYVHEQKKKLKIDEEEVFKTLNQDLQEKVTVCLNSFIIQTMPFFNQFDMDFISELTFTTKHQTFTIDENIFVEKDDSNELYYIESGRVAVLHRKTMSYVTDLNEKDYFGEIAFFTDMKRSMTMKSRDFTTVTIINQEIFLRLGSELYPEALVIYYKIKSNIKSHHVRDMKRFANLSLRCYICNEIGHRAIDCLDFDLKRGNLLQTYNKIARQVSNQMKKKVRQQVRSQSNSRLSPTVKLSRASNTDISKFNTIRALFGRGVTVEEKKENIEEGNAQPVAQGEQSVQPSSSVMDSSENEDSSKTDEQELRLDKSERNKSVSKVDPFKQALAMRQARRRSSIVKPAEEFQSALALRKRAQFAAKRRASRVDILDTLKMSPANGLNWQGRRASLLANPDQKGSEERKVPNHSSKSQKINSYDLILKNIHEQLKKQPDVIREESENSLESQDDHATEEFKKGDQLKDDDLIKIPFSSFKPTKASSEKLNVFMKLLEKDLKIPQKQATKKPSQHGLAVVPEEPETLQTHMMGLTQNDEPMFGVKKGGSSFNLGNIEEYKSSSNLKAFQRETIHQIQTSKLLKAASNKVAASINLLRNNLNHLESPNSNIQQEGNAIKSVIKKD